MPRKAAQPKKPKAPTTPDRTPRDLVDDREPYDRQPEETREAYEGFVTYRDLGSKRSYAKTAQKLGKSKTLIDTWGSRWRWQVRIDAWEAKLEQERRDEHFKQVREMNARHADMGQLMQITGSLYIMQILQRLANGEKVQLSAGEARKLTDIGAKMERTGRGEPDKLIHAKSENLNVSISAEGEQAIEKIARMLGVTTEELGP